MGLVAGPAASACISAALAAASLCFVCSCVLLSSITCNTMQPFTAVSVTPIALVWGFGTAIRSAGRRKASLVDMTRSASPHS